MVTGVTLLSQSYHTSFFCKPMLHVEAWAAETATCPDMFLKVVPSQRRVMPVQDSEHPIKDSAQSMNDSGRKSFMHSSGSDGMRSMSSNQRSGSGGIRNIMENLSRNQDASGQARPVPFELPGTCYVSQTALSAHHGSTCSSGTWHVAT